MIGYEVVNRLAQLCLLLCLMLLSGAARAQASEARSSSERARGTEVYVITFGPGDHPFSKFGHNAVLVLDHDRRTDAVYNFGTFSAASPTLISDFMQGRLLYWVSVGSWEPTSAAYAANNRSISAQKLSLTPVETGRLVALLAKSALPENRYYRYDYYLDNCSTKVRDVLDDVTDGGLADTKNMPAKQSWREHTSRLTRDSLGLNLGLNLLLAQGVDVPRSRWDEMFLPSALAETLATTRKADGSPLVAEQALWHRAERPPLAESPPRHLWLPLVGLTLGASLIGLSRVARKSRAALAVFTAVIAILGTLAGALGCVFAFFWFATDHDFAHANENLFALPPWALLLPVVAIGAFVNPQRWVRRAQRLALLLAAGSAVGFAVKVLPWFRQDNWVFLGFALGLWGLLALALRQAYLPALPHRASARAPTAAKLTRNPIEPGVY